MKFLTKLCLFQTLCLGICGRSAYTHSKESTAACLSRLYALDNESYSQLQSILQNATYSKLKSSSAVILHENYLRTFCTDKTEFGQFSDEWEALEIKRNAYATFEDYVSNTNDLFLNLSVTAAKNDRISVTLALLYYLSDAKTEVYLPLLRRAESHNNAESIILLMAFEEERRSALFEKLCESKELILRNDDTIVHIADRYNLTKGVENHD